MNVSIVSELISMYSCIYRRKKLVLLGSDSEPKMCIRTNKEIPVEISENKFSAVSFGLKNQNIF